MKHWIPIISQCLKEDAKFLKRTKHRARLNVYVIYVLTGNTGTIGITACKECIQYVNLFRWTAFWVANKQKGQTRKEGYHWLGSYSITVTACSRLRVMSTKRQNLSLPSLFDKSAWYTFFIHLEIKVKRNDIRITHLKQSGRKRAKANAEKKLKKDVSLQILSPSLSLSATAPFPPKKISEWWQCKSARQRLCVLHATREICLKMGERKRTHRMSLEAQHERIYATEFLGYQGH